MRRRLYSVFADIIHHCLSLEAEQLHLFYRMAFVPANSSIAGLRTRSHGPCSPCLTSGLAATGEWLPTFSHSSLYPLKNRRYEHRILLRHCAILASKVFQRCTEIVQCRNFRRHAQTLHGCKPPIPANKSMTPTNSALNVFCSFVPLKSHSSAIDAASASAI